MARRDEILAYADELLDLGRVHGLRAPGTAGGRRGGGDASRLRRSRHRWSCSERAAAAGAQLVIVHHGLLWDNEPRVIDARVRRRLQALFEADINLAGYHLALDAHPEVGNNALLARELGVEVDGPFARARRRRQRVDHARRVPRPSARADRPRAARLRRRSGRAPARRDHLRRRAALPTGGGRPGLRPLPHRRAGRAEPPSRQGARDQLRRRRALRDREARCPGAHRASSPSGSVSSGSSSSCRTLFERVARREYSPMCHASPGGAGPLISRDTNRMAVHRARRAPRADGFFHRPRKERHAESPHA